MADRRVIRKELWPRLSSIKKKEVWFKAAEELGLKITQAKGGTSHYVMRLQGYENWDYQGVVSGVYDPVRKDISEAIFKALLDRGFAEDDIWKGLGFLKRTRNNEQD